MKSKITVTLLLSVFLSVLISCNSSTKSNTTSTGNTTNSSVENAGSYTSKMTKSDKKKFYDNSNNVVYEIKYKPDGFKLRTESSKLLWKIKLYDDKIKISDNEENLNPYEIKIINNKEAKLLKDDIKIARLTFDDAKNNYSPSLLVNKISEIPEDQKRIIIDELVLKDF